MSERRTLERFAPAKLNLGLRIVGRLPDGYHLLDSLFVALDWGDSLEIEALPARGEARSRIELAIEPEAPFASVHTADEGPGLPTDERNLAVRAARGFLDAAAVSADLRLRLRKRIPAGAGLGGGSSDAAAVLRALAALYPEAMSPSDLAELALGLGADVPFFLRPEPSRVRGIGDRIQPIPQPEGLASWWLALANPGKSVATADVYAAFDADPGGAEKAVPALTGSEPGSTMPPFSGLLVDPSALGGLLRNHLEPAASRLCPAIQTAKQRLDEAGAVASGMSGSGATVFGVFASEAAARAAIERVSGAPGWCLGARILTRWSESEFE